MRAAEAPARPAVDDPGHRAADERHGEGMNRRHRDRGCDPRTHQIRTWLGGRPPRAGQGAAPAAQRPRKIGASMRPAPWAVATRNDHRIRWFGPSRASDARMASIDELVDAERRDKGRLPPSEPAGSSRRKRAGAKAAGAPPPLRGNARKRAEAMSRRRRGPSSPTCRSRRRAASPCRD